MVSRVTLNAHAKSPNKLTSMSRVTHPQNAQTAQVSIMLRCNRSKRAQLHKCLRVAEMMQRRTLLGVQTQQKQSKGLKFAVTLCHRAEMPKHDFGLSCVTQPKVPKPRASLHVSRTGEVLNFCKSYGRCTYRNSQLPKTLSAEKAFNPESLHTNNRYLS